MVFSSATFLFLFLPIAYLLYLIAPKWLKNPLLLITSLVFYGWGEPVFVLVLIASALANFAFALWLDYAHRKNQPKQLRLAMVLAVVTNIGLLVIFKYTGFLIGVVNQLFSFAIPLPHIPLPIGISFFTFQAVSYVIDVYRQDVPVQKKFSNLLLYISFFPKLFAGPIVKYHDMADQLEHRQLSLTETAFGIRRFIVGLAKKLLIANLASQVADRVFALDPGQLDMPVAWIGAFAYAVQIYFDFSGYSDMAIGLGHLFGFTFKENFLYPYTADSIQDFWRRWHISLSTWFKEYLYVPLGGNRKGLWRTGLNRITVFFLTGLWHGANWTFIIWGLYHGVFLLLETFHIIRVERFPRFLRYLYTLLVVVCGFVMFRAENVSQGLVMLRNMFAGWQRQPAAQALLTEVLSPGFILTMLVAAVAATPVLHGLRQRIQGHSRLAGLYEPVGFGISVLLFALCVLALSASTYNSFIYFRF